MRYDSSIEAPPAADLEAVCEMAAGYAERFARMGYDEPGILRMFQNPFYSAPHKLYRTLGHAAASAVIAQCLAGSGRRRMQPSTRAVSSPSGRGRSE